MKGIVTMIIAMVVIASCSNDETPTPEGNFDVYSGPMISFTKETRTDPREQANQDCINDQVCLTRGLQGSIYNIVSQFGSADNPEGTEWAFGTTEDISSLTFQGFQATHGNNSPSIVGRDMVLHLIEEDAYVDIKFTYWGRKRTDDPGAFSYERATR